MLNCYLEKNIQNKLELFNILHSKTFATMNDLLSLLPLGSNGVHTLINELNYDWEGLAKIEKQSLYFSITLNDGVTYLELLYALYRTSNVLHCLRFMILNIGNLPLTDFIDSQYLTKSSAYRIRERCKEYLAQIGLDVKGNQVIGEEYRIRFLIALLHYKFGIDCYSMDDMDVCITREFELSTNSCIDRTYPETTENEYGYFECLFTLLWKRKPFLKAPIHSSQLEQCKSIFVYDKLKAALKALEPKLGFKLTEYDYDYVFLVYCATNNCLFSNQWTQKDMDQMHEIVFSDPVFYDLLQRIERKLGKEIADSHVLKATLVYFYKKCLLGLQCIIPDKNFYLYSRNQTLTKLVFKATRENLEEWRKEQNLKYEIAEGHIFYLALQLEIIIKQNLKPVPIFVLSELSAELEVMTLYLKRLFPSTRAAIQPVFIVGKNKEFICSQKRSIIVINRKFKYLAKEWNLSANNTIVPVTVELNSQELQGVQNALVKYETENFLDFVRRL